jgi:hypothetical protein
MVGIASLVDRTACGLVGDVDPLPDLDIGKVSLGKDKDKASEVNEKIASIQY